MHVLLENIKLITKINNILIFREHFGIVYVDYYDSNRTRILKKSASWWEKVIAAGKIDTS